MNEVGIQILARLAAGVPVDADAIRRVPPDDPLAGMIGRVFGANGSAKAAFEAALAEHPDRDEIVRRMIAVHPRAPLPDAQGPPPLKHRFVLRTVKELLAMSPPAWRIDDVIADQSLATLFGAAGSMKTFEALEMAACTASGLPWHGQRTTRKGAVVYVAAEGRGGLGKRLKAWLVEHPDANLDGLHLMTEPLNLMDADEVTLFLASARADSASTALVILDTLARCMPGADENSARDMGVAVASMDRIRLGLGAAVVAIHHTGKNGEVERGSTALRGAVDTLIKMTADGASATISCEKQKDAEPFDNLTVRRFAVAGTDSCVLRFSADESTSELTPGERATLQALSDVDEEGAAVTPWKNASGQPDTSFYRYRTELIKRGHVDEQQQGKRKRYVVTALGRSTLASPPRTR
jgi:hypothetical protein